MSIRLAAPALLLLLFALPSEAATRRTAVTYVATISEIPAGTKAIDVWIPLPATRGAQVVTNRSIESDINFSTRRDDFGNAYAYARIANPPAELAIPVHFDLERNELAFTAPPERSMSLFEKQRATRADRLVTLSPRIKALSAEITKDAKTTADKARAIYDYVTTKMTYDKIAPGWGQGDTERACDVGKGNCTDFHSLFISLARAQGIPARFIIGFPMTSKEMTVKGYHCWAEFYVDGKGWIPVDASDASKSTDPALRSYLFGNLDPNRVQFTVGRDLVLEPRTEEPLNFFIYPHAEIDGKSAGKTSIALEWKATE